MKKLNRIFCLSAVMAVLAGCAAPAYDVEVYISPKVRDTYQVWPSLEVDVVGVNAKNAEFFKEIAVNDYFSPSNLLRGGTEHATLHFTEVNNAPKRLAKSDAVWEKFGETESDQLYLFVNLPSVPGKKMKSDLRKLVIPLESGLFQSSTRYFEITPSGLAPLKKRPEYTTEKPQTETTEKQQ